MAYPSKRTPEIEQEILGRLSKGEPLAKICRDEHLPTGQAFRDWMAVDNDLAIAYARARDDGFDAIALDCLAIADETANDTKIVGEDEREVCNAEWISRSKLRVETRLKLLAKWDPKRYGDKVIHSGDQENPVTFQQITRTIVDPASE